MSWLWKKMALMLRDRPTEKERVIKRALMQAVEDGAKQQAQWLETLKDNVARLERELESDRRRQWNRPGST
jgi:hypothetical protein